MKKVFRKAVYLSFLAMAMTGCQKESNVALLGNEIHQPIGQMQYTMDDVTHTLPIFDYKDMNQLIDNMFALAKDGYTVEIQNNSRVSVKYDEVITFKTTSEEEAKAWTTNMLFLGYDVTVSYDEDSGVYTCIARK